MLILFFLLSYLLGSLSFALIFSQWSGLPYSQTHSAHNPSITNMLELGHTKLVCLILLGDALKAIIPLFIAKSQGVGSGQLAWLIVASTIGHMFPIFFHFKGSDDITSTLSGLLVLSWPLGILTISVWIGVFILFHYTSLASLVAILSMLIITLLFSPFKMHAPIALLVGLLLARHSKSWVRLWTGSESKVQIADYFKV